MNTWTDGWVDKCMDFFDGGMVGWMHGWVDGCTDRWMDACMHA